MMNRAAPADGHRARILEAATRLLAEEGREAVSTRRVSAAAGVQAPTIYRIFGDKQGLLDEVAAHGFATHVGDKAALPVTDDPVDDLRTGWDFNVAFGLANPALYALMYAEPRRERQPPAAVAALEVLAGHIARIARAGRLRVDEVRATRVVHAAGTGTTLSLIALPEEQRDMSVSRISREAVIAAITTDTPAASDGGATGAAVAMRAALPGADGLTFGERALLGELLDRIAAGSARATP